MGGKDDRPKCRACGGRLRYRVWSDDWRCTDCGRLEPDHGDHPGRDDHD